MIKNKTFAKIPDATKARVVRAFYDAAQRALDERAKAVDAESSAVSDAFRQLNAVIAQAGELTSKAFAAELRRASDEYFARVSDALANGALGEKSTAPSDD